MKMLLVVAALAVSPALASAQSARQQAEKELARAAPNAGLHACTLITRAEVKAAVGRDPYADPEEVGQGGWICSVGVGEVKVYGDPGSWDKWQGTLNAFKNTGTFKEATATGFGERAQLLYFTPKAASDGKVGLLAVKSGKYTLVLSVDVPSGQPAESTRPALESLMKTMLTRLPK